MTTPHAHAVLLVEDDDATRDALAFFLGSTACAVRAVDGGLAALAALDEGFDPCAVIVDIRMPEMDGWELVQRIRMHPTRASVPVIMVSGDAAEASRALRFGVRAYLTKPVEPDAIAAAVDRHCARHGRP